MAFSNIANKETEQKCLSHFCDFIEIWMIHYTTQMSSFGKCMIVTSMTRRIVVARPAEELFLRWDCKVQVQNYVNQLKHTSYPPESKHVLLEPQRWLSHHRPMGQQRKRVYALLNPISALSPSSLDLSETEPTQCRRDRSYRTGAINVQLRWHRRWG